MPQCKTLTYGFVHNGLNGLIVSTGIRRLHMPTLESEGDIILLDDNAIVKNVILNYFDPFVTNKTVVINPT